MVPVVRMPGFIYLCSLELSIIQKANAYDVKNLTCEPQVHTIKQNPELDPDEVGCLGNSTSDRNKVLE